MVRTLIGETAARYGVPDVEVQRIGLLTDEVLQYVITNSFDRDEPGQFRLSMWRRPGRIELTVEDHGLPVDFNEHSPLDRSQVPFLALKAFADEVRFFNLGRSGKRFEFVCSIEGAPATVPDAGPARPDTAETDAPEPVTLRMMRPEDAVEASRCIYRAYGNTYCYDFIYHPEKIAEMVALGRMASAVAVTESGRIIGHLAMLFGESGAKVCETAIAVVDPRYRGQRLFERMKMLCHEKAAALGLYGIYSEAVTPHPFSQKSNLSLGARETGIVLSYLPNRVVFKQISEQATESRRPSVLFHMRVHKEPQRTVYLPEHHAPIIREIFSLSELDRIATPVPSGALEAVRGKRTRFDLQLKTDTNIAFLQIRSYGSDVLLVVHNHLRDLRQKAVIAVFLDLPLGEPLTAALCKAFESFGFCFAGVLVEFADGDVLRLQFIDEPTIDRDLVKMASDFGYRLLDYILEQHRSARRNTA